MRSGGAPGVSVGTAVGEGVSEGKRVGVSVGTGVSVLSGIAVGEAMGVTKRGGLSGAVELDRVQAVRSKKRSQRVKRFIVRVDKEVWGDLENASLGSASHLA